MKILAFFCALMIGSAAQASIDFNPNFGLGLGWQQSVDDSKNDDLYVGAKVFLFETPTDTVGLNLIGIGLGINFDGYAQLLLSPVNLRLFNFLSIAPEYGVGLNNSDDKYGVSVSLGF